ncbi:MAG TPA: aldo/keto reductase [Opitutaceae bacterium]|nr:aldo/keto reductase [Opitutaceae bacterium]
MKSSLRPTNPDATLPALSRREALKSLLGLTAALMTPEIFGALDSTVPPPASAPTRDRFGELLPQRKLGRKGPMMTMLGLGGAHIGFISRDAVAEKTIETAMAGGIRYFETAAGYSQGLAETRYGQFLTPKYRDAIFLATKTQSSDAARARRDLDMSLRRMKTDYLDLWHMHSLHSPEDVNHRIEAGVLDVLLDAKAKGKVRHIGFTGHVTPASHVHMLARGGEKGDPFTACQMPINVLDPSYHSFILNVVPKAVAAGVGVLAMKTLSNGGFFGRPANSRATTARLVPDRLSVAEALHFVWSLPVSVLVSGAETPEMIQEKIDLARSFQGMDQLQRQQLVLRVADLAGPAIETYKVPV